VTSTSLRMRFEAEPLNLTVARAFVGTTLRTVDQSQSLIEDLRLAVSELLTVLVTGDHGPIDLELRIDGGVFTAIIGGPAALPAIPEETREIVGRLTDDGVRVDEADWVIRATLL
jgi:hypothetical protein